MIDDRDDLLREIGATLSIEPTPEFAAKVRRAVAERQRELTWWRFAIVVGSACVLVMTGVVLWHSGRLRTEPDRLADGPPSPVSTAVRDVVEPHPQPTRVEPVGAPRARTRRPIVATRASRVPETIVPPDQAEGLRRWMAMVHNRTGMLPATRTVVDEGTGELLPLPEIAGIDLPALKIDPLPGSEDAPEKGGTDE